MTRIEFHPDAEAEARETAAAYDRIRPELGDNFRAEFSLALDRIHSNPQMYAVEQGAARIAPLRRFPLGLIYEIEDQRVWILAVAHHHRHPGYWLKRKSQG